MQAEFIGNYLNITSTTVQTIVRAGTGQGGVLLHCITFNKPVATGTLTIYDSGNQATSTQVVGTITTPTSPLPVTLFYDIQVGQGLYIVPGVIAQDITIVWR